MTIVFCLLLYLAFWHYIYEAILAPSIRLRMKHRLFELRDRLRMIQIERGSVAMRPDISILHDGLNYYLGRLEKITPSLVVRSHHRIQANPEMRKAIEKRVMVIADSDDHRIQGIYDEIDRLLSRVLLVNAGGWGIYILPIALALTTYSKLEKRVAELFMTPERSMNSLMEHGLHA